MPSTVLSPPRSLVLKPVLRIGFLTVAALLMLVTNVHAVQVSYSFNETGGAGLFSGSEATFLDQALITDAGDYQFTGSVEPERVGLIGVRTGFVADVRRVNVTSPPPLPCESEEDPCFSPPPTIETLWDRVQIETRAAARYGTTAIVNTVDDFNGNGFIQFDWRITGTSSIQLGGQELVSTLDPRFVPGHVGVSGINATTLATIGFVEESEVGSDSLPDAFLHDPVIGERQTIDFRSASLGLESILVPIDLTDSNVVDVNFEFAVSTSLDVTRTSEFASILAIHDADFSNTATLESVTVFEEDDFGNLVEVNGATVTDAITGQSLVASTVPEPSTAVILILAGCAGSIRRRRVA